MANELLLVGTKIELKRASKTQKVDGEASVAYVSQILDRDEDGNIIAAMPISEGHIVPIEVGSVFQAYFYTSKGIFKGRCRIASRGKEQNIFVMTIQLVDELVRYQRREYYRLTCLIDAKVRILNVTEVLEYSKNFEMPEELSGEPEDCVIVDISGGGVRFISNRSYPRDGYVYLEFNTSSVSGEQEFKLMGRVVMSIKSEANNGKYDNRIQFKVNSKDKREEIVKFIFDEQRRLRQKERG